MKSATRPQYHRLRRMLEMIREGTRAGSPPNSGHFVRELEVSRRTVMRDLDFLRDDHNALLALNSGAGRIETFALSRCRSLAGTGQHFPRPAVGKWPGPAENIQHPTSNRDMARLAGRGEMG